MVNRVKASVLFGLVLVLASCAKPTNQRFESAFSAYKALFVVDGRVVDTGNNNASHSEGQGYGMLFAVEANDRETFGEMWQWTKTVLKRTDDLFSWRYTPCKTKDSACVDDPNNASDGDILIAWALLRAAQRWGVSRYEIEARTIIQAVEEKLIVTEGSFSLLLPGESGFVDNNGVQFNLSYWIFPALSSFAEHSDNPNVWQDLFASGIALAQKARFSSHRLPSDWARFNNGVISLDNVIAGEFGFNAVRIPLHLVWSTALLEHPERDDILETYSTWWAMPFVPATMSLTNEKKANYKMTPGMHAVEQAFNKIVNDSPPTWPQINRELDYYSASLLLLSMLAVSDVS